jgi:hypothetical protein
MALANIVTANVVVAEAAVEAQPLDIVIVGLTLTGPQDALWGSSLIRQVTGSDYLDTLADVGITDGEAAYEALQVLFSQDAQPRLVYIAKRATPVAQQTDFLLDGGAGAAADGLYRITLAGEQFDVNAVGQTRAQVVTTMQGLIDASPRFTAAIGGTPETVDVTSAEAGAGFSFAAQAPAGESWTITPTQANVGLSSDLTAWEAEKTDWYLVTIPEPVSEYLADDVASTVEAFTRDITSHLRTDSATDTDAPSTPNVATRLAAKNYARTFLRHVPTATDYGHMGPIGLKMPTLPGSDTWANKTIRATTGTAWTFAQRAALVASPYAILDQIASIGAALSGGERVLDGTPFDVIRGADYLKASIIAAVLTVLRQTPAPSYTPQGFAEIGNAISSTLADFVRTGFLAAAYPNGDPGFTVTIPEVPQPGSALRLARETPPFKFTALVAGSIEIVDQIDGVLIQ